MGGAGGQGLAATIGTGGAAQARSQATDPAYVYDQTPDQLGSYVANFFFDPTDTVTSDSPVDIFVGLAEESEPIFGVQFQHSSDEPGMHRIRAWAMVDDQPVYSAWDSIAAGPQNIQLDWQSNQYGSVLLYVEGEQVAALNADTAEYKLEEVRLGPSGGMDGAQGSASGTMYFDEFLSYGDQGNTGTIIFLPMLQNN